jgi:hypothetical protein
MESNIKFEYKKGLSHTFPTENYVREEDVILLLLFSFASEYAM